MKKITFLLILINQIVFAQVTNEGKPKNWVLNNSEISNPLSSNDFNNTTFLVYPNPSNGTFNVVLNTSENYFYQVLNS